MSRSSATGSDIVAPIRRAVTLPAKLMQERRLSNEITTNLQESDRILFFHPSARIVKFAPDAPPGVSQSAPSADFDYPVDTIETLSWRSPTERTVAVGRLRLEMVSGLSPFLKCGTVVQAILKNSQCWCVDRKSTFVLRIRSLTYYRIELPSQTSEEIELVEKFKSALAKVLRYEVTPCPFQRGFSVPLPAEAHLPKKKRAWRPKHQCDDISPVSDPDRAGPDTGIGLERVQQPHSVDTSDSEVTDDSTSITANETPQHSDTHNNNSHVIIGETNSFRKPSITDSGQSVNDILARFQPIPESDSEDDTQSFYSLLMPELKTPLSLSSPNPPTSPLDNHPSNRGLPYSRSHTHNRDISVATITPNSTQPIPTGNSFHQELDMQEETESCLESNATASTISSTPSSPGASTVFATGTEARFTRSDSRENLSLNLRPDRFSRKRDLSPLPPESILEYPYLQSSKTSITSTVLHKTCSLVLIPSIQLLFLLIHLASRITAGFMVQKVQPDIISKTTNENDDGGVYLGRTRNPDRSRNSFQFRDSGDSLSDFD